MPGEGLRQRLARERQLSIDDAVRFTCEIAEALDHAHHEGDGSPLRRLPNGNSINVALRGYFHKCIDRWVGTGIYRFFREQTRSWQRGHSFL